MANLFSEEEWQRLLPHLRSTFTRLTEADLRDCAPRLDLTVAKVQNRHWLDRVTAQRQVLDLVQRVLAGSGAAS
ncbi:MAG: hypothetical protein EA402_03585 [Planctomycetota bacterium]|nr:MAG: hypothetical protein EA402_03585 [Planctomycetota bacterium]